MCTLITGSNIHNQANMVLSNVLSWGGSREDNNNSLKRDLLMTPPAAHSHSRCMLFGIFYNFTF